MVNCCKGTMLFTIKAALENACFKVTKKKKRKSFKQPDADCDSMGSIFWQQINVYVNNSKIIQVICSKSCSVKGTNIKG